MQSDQQFYPQKAVPTLADQVANNYMHIPVASAFGPVFPPCAKHLPPLHGIEFQPSEYERKDVYDVGEETSSFLKEDSDDIDALLSSEEEEQVEYDEEEVSTARTFGNYEFDTADSRSAHGSKPKKNKSSSYTLKSSGNSSCCDPEIKRLKMKEMVKVLRGIVPGADEMDTVAVLDGAVRYLKSLKVEVQKLGVGNFKYED
ncbi:hypothetical protein ERO13_D10G039900v2 [Gossypium hirsutum]|uniref:Transcription factor bHLH144 isoform X2 n=1 Tax=Gossypium hirsutum TaxID=3635 RepID=A0A1U8K5W2_GOSHI|nr:transcription factor bHLH144 isoform X2 [Gossypium hirsutum]KAG4124427.1 hypothetical protein ERO13_D10G039900v2 [Gossypium hirsutum]